MARDGPEIFSNVSPAFARWPSPQILNNFDSGRKLAKDDFRKLDAGNDQRLAGAQKRDRFGAGRNSGERGHIAAANIFGEGGTDGATDFSRSQFHTAKMKVNR